MSGKKLGKRVMRKADIYLDIHRKRGIPVCTDCHDAILAGRYDGPRLRRIILESRMR